MAANAVLSGSYQPFLMKSLQETESDCASCACALAPASCTCGLVFELAGLFAKIDGGDHAELGYAAGVTVGSFLIGRMTFGAGRSAIALLFCCSRSGATLARNTRTRGEKLPSVVPCPAPNR